VLIKMTEDILPYDLLYCNLCWNGHNKAPKRPCNVCYFRSMEIFHEDSIEVKKMAAISSGQVFISSQDGIHASSDKVK